MNKEMEALGLLNEIPVIPDDIKDSNHLCPNSRLDIDNHLTHARQTVEKSHSGAATAYVDL